MICIYLMEHLEDSYDVILFPYFWMSYLFSSRFFNIVDKNDNEEMRFHYTLGLEF